MRHKNVLSLCALITSLSTVVEASDAMMFNQKNLYGHWHCQHAMADSNTQMKIDYSINYLANGQSNGRGTLLLKLPNFPEMEYGVSNRSTWKVINQSLILSSIELALVNRSHPELDSILNLTNMIPQKNQESSTIIELTPSKLIARSDAYGGVYSCVKVKG